MKKSVLILALVILGCCTANAQIYRFWVACHGGAGFSQTYGDEAGEYKYNQLTFNYTAGLQFGMYIGEYLGFSVQVDYTRKGSKFEDLLFKTGTKTFQYIQLTPRLNIFILPISLKYRPVLYVGPYISYLLDAQVQYKTGQPAVNIRSNLKQYDVGMSFGIGVNFNFRRFNFLPEIRYDLGFINLPKNGRSVHNGNLMLTIGFGYQF